MTRTKTKRMTVRVIESLPGPPSNSKTSNIEYSVAQETNLCLAVYKNGSRSWRFKQKFRGKRLFITIGPYPLFSLQEAIDKTRHFKRLIADGIDPRQEQQPQSQLTLAQFVEQDFLPYARKHYKTFHNQQNMLDKRIIKTFGATPLADISKREVMLFHQQVCDETSGTTGNRHLSLLSSIFKLALEYDLLEKNPCRGIKKAKENRSRDRFLQEDEYTRFIQVLQTKLDQPSACAIFLLIALGMRKSELLSLRWEDVSLADRHLHLRDTKNGESRYVALNSVSHGLLTKMKQKRKASNPWVFPSRTSSESGHLQDVRRTFATVCRESKITGLRIHDLRRSHASHLLNAGVDISIVGKILGHKSLKSTQIYAKVATSSLARTSEIASRKIEEVMNQAPDS
ncbi:site-specific integrase [Desulfuromonas acetoxidans]|uniref:Phage integrase n=1 Tax=Desulfuromonas acetoxidans (strain DSM 684 / 11070) TaxID=281689 RepID=Q1K3L6_DESA6|nr:site-specific integrase [Desulfuromonas acetoxidans]EAT16958.1 phage integrase [Desulfuromonas acetoxidans DSM 684]MBF0644511.1 site-specific integrase [Desulfuromonas acetoxidans]NVD23962.1 site-specific integrase [Desulfuromonas acetoxidans]NVE16259.1 site-specific integrase [Desulfuromonas acetoxidans]